MPTKSYGNPEWRARIAKQWREGRLNKRNNYPLTGHKHESEDCIYDPDGDWICCKVCGQTWELYENKFRISRKK